MPVNPFITFDQNILQPVYARGGVPVVRDVTLPGGIDYAKGTCLAQVLGTGTPVNDVQTITITGAPAGGTWTATLNGFTTGNIAYNASATVVQAALVALDQVGTGNLTVTGGPGPGTAWVVTGSGDFLGRLLPVLTVNGTGLTGGTSPAIANVHTTSGKPAGGYFIAYDNSTYPVLNCILDRRTITSTGGFIVNDLGISASVSARAYTGGDFYTSELVGIDTAGIADVGRIINGNSASLTDTDCIMRMNL